MHGVLCFSSGDSKCFLDDQEPFELGPVKDGIAPTQVRFRGCGLHLQGLDFN